MDNFSKKIYDAGKIEATFNNLKALMSTMNVSLDKAMDMLKTRQKNVNCSKTF